MLRLDPLEYCIDCGWHYGFADEACRNCGFAPVDDEEDGERQERALAAYRQANPKEPQA